MEFEILQRSDIVNCQILCVASASFLMKVVAAGRNNIEYEGFSRIIKLVFILDIESALSTMVKFFYILSNEKKITIHFIEGR